ncbi:MAG: DUF3298 domain-containing protein [Candidatus Xenobium sp.]|jgi:hypothetical protein|nr:DUF3298 and DUF4163 domain-containing protein [Burkholderiales bacterium]
MNRSILRVGLLVLVLLVIPALSAHAEVGKPSLTLGRISEKKSDYQIRMLFPKLAWSARPQVARAFNKASRAPVDRAIAEFRQKMAEPSEERPDFVWELRSEWETRHKGTDFISGVLNFGAYLGGPHPSPWLVSLNFDLRHGRALELADIFKPGSPWPERLSAWCVRELKTREMTDPDPGASADPQNFVVWTMAPQGLTILFPPYQVAPYSAGVQEVMVPWSEVADLLRPGSPAAPLAGLRP